MCAVVKCPQHVYDTLKCENTSKCIKHFDSKCVKIDFISGVFSTISDSSLAVVIIRSSQ